ncbi:unnamed protein product [Larinioides sclopetarius]|uniref:Uncharacterized protein n=1 Tax=Larinioides sclopetarius TaxID=280406 RepID=A0AAV1Z0I5_9ARAC
MPPNSSLSLLIGVITMVTDDILQGIFRKRWRLAARRERKRIALKKMSRWHAFGKIFLSSKVVKYVYLDILIAVYAGIYIIVLEMLLTKVVRMITSSKVSDVHKFGE